MPGYLILLMPIGLAAGVAGTRCLIWETWKGERKCRNRTASNCD